MFEATSYLLEVDGEAAGILVRDGSRYVFHASAPWATPLDGLVFSDVRSAERAIKRDGFQSVAFGESISQ